MMISQTAEYALRTLVWLGGRPDEPVGTRQISEAAQVPPGYLSKVLQMLARAGLVISSPGRSGGFRLARAPEEITVLDGLQAVGPVQRIRECPLHLKSHGTDLCPLHRKLDDAMAQMETAFGQTTIAELLSGKSGPRPLHEL